MIERKHIEAISEAVKALYRIDAAYNYDLCSAAIDAALAACDEREGEMMDKCQKCGIQYANDEHRRDHGIETCLRRQLAAANERAGELEAEMVELRAAWFRVATHDGFNGSIEAEISEGDMAVFNRILGGA